MISRTRQFRFRITSLLWLTVVVASFFIGRQSEQIAKQMGQAWRLIWPSAASIQVLPQRDGSLLLVMNSPVPRINNTESRVCDVEVPSADTLRLVAKNDGTTNIICERVDSTKEGVRVAVVNGRFATAQIIGTDVSISLIDGRID